MKAVQEGTLDEAILDRAVERILNIVFEYVDNRKEQPLTLEEDHELLYFVRGEQKFSGIDALKEQMYKDKLYGEQYIKSHQ